MGRPFCGRINRPANWPSPGKKKGERKGKSLLTFDGIRREGLASAKTFLGGRGKGWGGGMVMAGGRELWVYFHFPPSQASSQPGTQGRRREARCGRDLLVWVGWLAGGTFNFHGRGGEGGFFATKRKMM